MIRTFMRRCLSGNQCLASAILGLMVCAPLCAAPTMDILTGAGRYVDVPGTSVPSRPNLLAFGPDGLLYVADPNGNIARFNPATGTITALPANGSSVSFNVILRARGFTSGLAFDAGGAMYVSNAGRMTLIDPDAGTLTDLGAFAGAEQAVFAPDGTMYFVNGGSRVQARLPSGAIVNFAGTGTFGFSGDGGPALNANLGSIFGIARAPNGDLYLADSSYHRIRKISAATGIITTFAGTGNFVFNGDGLPALQTNFREPHSLAFDPAGNLHVGALANYRIQRIDASTGIVTTVIGTGVAGGTGDGGPASAARIFAAREIQFDGAGNLYFSDGGFDNGVVRRIAADTGIVTRVIGNLTVSSCGVDVPARQVCLGEARGLDVDAGQNLLVGDYFNRRIHRVSATSGILSQVAYSGLLYSYGIEHDAAGNIYVGSGDLVQVYRIDPATGAFTTVTGNGTYGFSGDGGLATAASISQPDDVALDDEGNLYIADRGNNRIRRVDAATGIISTYAGGGPALGDGGLAIDAFLNDPVRVEFDPAGNLVVSESRGCRLRRIAADTGIITTIAGTGVCASTPPAGGLAATDTGIGAYTQFAFDPTGSIYLAWSARIYRIDAASGTLDVIPGPVTGLTTAEGIGFTRPQAMEFDAAGRLYVTDMTKPFVFRISGLLDSTPPLISPNVVGTTGNEGWYRSDVQVSWSVTDAESAILSSSGCASTVITEDTPELTLTCSATSQGGATSGSITIRRDATAPLLEFDAPSPPADANGWHNGDVSFAFTASDGLSGVASTSQSSPVIATQTGVGIRLAVTVEDIAGNSATFETEPVNIDRTPPVVQPEVTGTPGSNGWYTSDVTVGWLINEYPPSLVSNTGCETVPVTSDTAGATFTCSVTSAGGTTTESVTVKRDATPPALAFGTPSPVPNANGWNKINISVPFTRSDALSGLASTSTASPLVISTEGAGVTGDVVVTDLAGNTNTFTSVPRNLDKTPPVVSIVSPANGATYGFYQDVIADFGCTDISLLSCVGTTADGDLVNTKSAGARTFRVTGKDLVNFTAAVTHPYTVASLFNFTGFVAPAGEPPTLNLVTRGSLVPIRWQLPDGNGGFVTNPASFTSATVGSLTCGSAPVVPYPETASGMAGISFDAATNTFTYNWQTSASWTGCRKLTIRLRDNTLRELRFRFQ